MYLPQARSDQLVVRELPDETLIYDEARNKAHCLNRTVALVWRLCDGKRSPAALCRILEEQLHLKNAEALVQLALEQLGRRHLLVDAPAPLSESSRSSRRANLKMLVAAAIALPLVMSITAKAVAQSVPPT